MNKISAVSLLVTLHDYSYWNENKTCLFRWCLTTQTSHRLTTEGNQQRRRRIRQHETKHISYSYDYPE